MWPDLCSRQSGREYENFNKRRTHTMLFEGQAECGISSVYRICVQEYTCVQEHCTSVCAHLITRKNPCSGHFCKSAHTFLVSSIQVKVIINACLKPTCFTKSLMVPSAGTWVTFGGQISDEVSRSVASITQPSQLASAKLRSHFLGSAITTSEQLWQFYNSQFEPPPVQNGWE